MRMGKSYGLLESVDVFKGMKWSSVSFIVRWIVYEMLNPCTIAKIYAASTRCEHASGDKIRLQTPVAEQNRSTVLIHECYYEHQL